MEIRQRRKGTTKEASRFGRKDERGNDGNKRGKEKGRKGTKRRDERRKV